MDTENIYSFVKKIIPADLLNVIAKAINYKMTPSRLFRILNKTNTESRICFNSGVKKMGYVTAGYGKGCDILFKRGKNIKIIRPDSTIDRIVLEEFLEKIEEDEVFINLFRECSRLLKPNGKIKIIFKDSRQIYKKILKKKGLLDRHFWLSKKRYIFSDYIAKINDIFFKKGPLYRILDYDSLCKVLINAGFENINKLSYSKYPTTALIASKSEEKWKLSILARELPKNTKDLQKDVPIYFFDCDPLQILNNFKNINIDKLRNRDFTSVIGSQYFINLIPILKPNKILLFDSNNLQVRYLKMLIEIIDLSKNFEEFMEKYFSRPYKDNIERFLSQKYSCNILDNTKKLVSDKYIFDNSIGKIAKGKFLKLGAILPILKIENNTMCQSITVLKREYFKPGPEINVLYTCGGLAKNFDYVKQKLIKADVIQAKLQDERIIESLNDNSVLYVSNIGESDWIYNDFADTNLTKIKSLAIKKNLAYSFRRQWEESVVGFKKFLSEISANFWLIDATGNIFNSNELLLERSNSHEWLWQKVKSLIIGKCVEIIHMEDGEWGFNEYLDTINIERFIKKFKRKSIDTVIFHILLANGVDIETFVKAVKIASLNSKRIIIIEHDRDSENFGSYSNPNIVDIRFLINLLRKATSSLVTEFNVTWSGASRRNDEKIHLSKANLNRNVIVVIDF